MEGRFEDYTLGRNIKIERVKEIYHMFRKHDFQIAGIHLLREVRDRRGICDQARRWPRSCATIAVAVCQVTKAEAGEKLASYSAHLEGCELDGPAGGNAKQIWPWVAGGCAVAGAALWRHRRIAALAFIRN